MESKKSLEKCDEWCKIIVFRLFIRNYLYMSKIIYNFAPQDCEQTN